RAVSLVRDHVEQLVRTLAHVADAPALVLEQLLAANLFHVLVEDDALHLPRSRDLAVTHAADEQISGPLRDSRTRVEGHSRRRDRRHEVDDRRNRALELE